MYIMITLSDAAGAALDVERGSTPRATYVAACLWRSLRRTTAGAGLPHLVGPGRPRTAVEPESATKRPGKRPGKRPAAKKRTTKGTK